MTDKYAPDSAEAFLRAVELHGPTLLVLEQHIKPMAREMDQKMIIGTQSRWDYVRQRLAENPELGPAQPAPAPKHSLSELKQMTASQLLDVSNKVPAPTLNGLKQSK